MDDNLFQTEFPDFSNIDFDISLSKFPSDIFQNFEDRSDKNLSRQNSQMIPAFPENPISQDNSLHLREAPKKTETTFNHAFDINQMSNIVSGKRSRKQPEPSPVEKPKHQNLPENKALKSSASGKKRGRPSLKSKASELSLQANQALSRTRSSQNTNRPTNSNLSQSQISIDSSKRRMAPIPQKIENQFLHAKKLHKENSVVPVNPRRKNTRDDEMSDSEEEEEESEEEATYRSNLQRQEEELLAEQFPRTRSLKGTLTNNNNNSRSRKVKGPTEDVEDKAEENKVIRKITRKITDKDFNVENFLKIEEKIKTLNGEYQKPGTYINCDLRYFNLDFLVDKAGFFDVVLMDPPWRIKGAQQNDSSFMFSNSKFNLEYDTMSNEEIFNLKVEKLSKKGFLFLWILSNQIHTASEMMNKWGYELVDQIIWVKLQGGKIKLSQGYYFMHSFEICLVGMKCPPGESLEYSKNITNDVLFGNFRAKSQKPEELYELIDMIMPGSRKIELFARNHNLRPGWFSLGNQLGETFEKWYNNVDCDKCKKVIYVGIKRYKSRYEPDYDICENCFKEDKREFFEMANRVNEDVLHHYHSCNQCLVEPIWGTRFSCQECENFDLCECCFDKNLRNKNSIHDIYHNFRAIEVPILAHGLPAHLSRKCNLCSQKPILGACFACSKCPNLNFCQNCFFSKPRDKFKSRGHQVDHEFQILTDPVEKETKLTQCSWCEVSPIPGQYYKCENCYNFSFCEDCYNKRDTYNPKTATTHKFYHNWTLVNERGDQKVGNYWSEDEGTDEHFQE